MCALQIVMPPARRSLRGDFNSHVCGIPCRIDIGYCEPFTPGRFTSIPEHCYPDEGGGIEFDVLDRNGRAAPWLERKLTPTDTARIEAEINAHLGDKGDY